MDKESLYQALLTFLNEPKPRKVPDTFTYSNPIAGLFILLGGIFSLMSVVFVILNLISQKTSAWALYILSIMSVICIIILFYGLLNRKTSVKYLANGDLAKGLVISVSPLPARINSRSFFEVKVKYNSPTTNDLMASDVVDNWSMEYFLDARDSKKMVDVLFLPDRPKQVLLIHKIVTIKQFD